MKILITCGHPYSGLQIAFDILVQAGLALPQLSRRELLSPTELHDKIFAAKNIDLNGLGVNAPLEPGKQWQDLAVDLLMGTRGQADWGWADARSVWLLDFWKKLDAETRFVLIYSSPEFALGTMLRDKRVNPGDSEDIISSWIAYNSEMLRFYNRNPEHSLLINLSTVIRDLTPFVEMLNETFGTHLNAAACQKRELWDGTAITATLAQALLENNEEAHALLYELESTANLADYNGFGANTEKNQAMVEYLELLARIDDANVETGALREHCRRQDEERKQLDRELQLQAIQRLQIQSDLDCLNNEHAELRLQLKELQTERTSNPPDLAQENELLLVQLHHVQEEFEYYYLKWKELSATLDRTINEQTFLDRFWRRHPPNEFFIDFRNEIDGENWYYAEPDGRWAGPGCVSTIQIPPLHKGRYEFYLDVVDAMEREIVTGMEVSLNGAVLKIKVEGRRKYPVMVSSEFLVEDLPPRPIWEFQFKFPKVASPIDLGSEDQRNLALRVRSLKLQKIV